MRFYGALGDPVTLKRGQGHREGHGEIEFIPAVVRVKFGGDSLNGARAAGL